MNITYLNKPDHKNKHKLMVLNFSNRDSLERQKLHTAPKVKNQTAWQFKAIFSSETVQ